MGSQSTHQQLTIVGNQRPAIVGKPLGMIAGNPRRPIVGRLPTHKALIKQKPKTTIKAHAHVRSRQLEILNFFLRTPKPLSTFTTRYATHGQQNSRKTAPPSASIVLFSLPDLTICFKMALAVNSCSRLRKNTSSNRPGPSISSRHKRFLVREKMVKGQDGKCMREW
jgi:hypothetical protein